MLRRRVGLLFAVVAACTDSNAAREKTDAQLSNVVLIVVDTLRRDHLGCYGYERPISPAIDRLAADSVVFDNATSQAPWTTPAVGALLTSRYPTELNILGDRSVLPDGVETLAELLRAHEVKTGAVISHSFSSSRWRFDQGFVSFDENNIKGHKGVTSKEVADGAIAFLEQQRGGRFFLWAHFFDPHFGYQLHPDFDPEPGLVYQGPVKPGVDVKVLIKMRNEGRLGAEDLRQVIRCYDSEIAFTSHHIGRLLERLGALGLAQNTLVVLVADHGEAFGEHDRLGHAKTLYAELLSVPLIVRDPRRPAGRSRVHASSIDVAPTILAALGIAVPASMRGRDLFSSVPAPPVFSETSRFNRLRSIVADDYKLILDLESGNTELYRTTGDPAEIRDLSNAEPAVEARLLASLREWVQDSESRKTEKAEIDLTGTEREQLRQLGYEDD